MTLTGSTLSGNSAGAGGGVVNGGTLTVTAALSPATPPASAAVSATAARDAERLHRLRQLRQCRRWDSNLRYADGHRQHCLRQLGQGRAPKLSGTLRLPAAPSPGNSATYGGGILNDGTMSVSGSTVSGNSATDNGGASRIITRPFTGGGFTTSVT